MRKGDIGRTIEEIYGIDKAQQIREKMKKNHKDMHGKNNPFYGKHHTDKIKEQLKLKKVGIKLTPDHKINISNAMKGKNNWMKNRKLTPEWKENILRWKLDEDKWRQSNKKRSATMQGIELEDWKGFTNLEPYDQNFTNNFKNQIRKRDNQICMNCGIHREKLKRAFQIHHINYDKLCSIEQNCISLCESCHCLSNKNRPYWQKLFQEKLSKLYGYKYQDGKVILELKIGVKK